MYSSLDTSQIPLTTERIWEILHLPKTGSHIRKMYKIGSEEFQESGFAVYQKKLGKFAVSKLIKPTINEVSIDAKNLRDELGSISMAPLVRNKITASALTRDELDTDDGYDIMENDFDEYLSYISFSLSTEAQARIKAIKGNIDLSKSKKRELCLRVKESDYKKNKARDAENIRQDIVLVAHNHPINPMRDEHVDDSMAPSGEDLLTYERLRIFNPNSFEAIVGSDKRRHKLVLYAAVKSSKQSPEAYKNFLENSNKLTAKSALGRLSIYGYGSVMLDMTDKGKPKPDNYKAVEQFVQSLK